jgi:hypothetical protein
MDSLDHKINQVETEEQENVEIEEKKKGRRRGKDNETKGGPLRDKHTGNYLPDPAAEGSPHTTLGTRKSDSGSYTQGATFDEREEFKGRTDVTDHGRKDHLSPHYHPATGPNSAHSPPESIPTIF